jgi:cation-transporting ATPase E
MVTASAVLELQLDARFVDRGLSETEACSRRAARSRPRKVSPSRSCASIVRANDFTVFNLILATAGIVTLVYGQWQDASSPGS